MLNSFASSKPTVIPGTWEPFPSRTIKGQYIEIPSYWIKERSSGHQVVKRSVTILGMVDVEKYNRIRSVQYGTVQYKNWTVTVVEDGTRWLAVAKEAI
jgi:hypothetical protein